MTSNVMWEITPLTQGDCFTVFSRVRQKFDFPLHCNEEYELTLILNAKGAKRVIGEHAEIIGHQELILIAPDLYHTWFTHQCQSDEITEVTIRFHKDLFDEKFLERNQLSFIKNMLERSQGGILFSSETTQALKERILLLDKKTGFDSVLELFSILHQLSVSRNMRTLSDSGSVNKSNYNNRRIEKVFEYMSNNYYKQVSLAEVAKIANMPEASFSRFIKKHTGKTFIDTMNEIKLEHASRMLIDTTGTVAEIAYKCGFHNISNFNRVFKRKKFCIPKEFRETYTRNRVFI